MFNFKAFLLFLTVFALVALAVEARQGTMNVWLAVAGAVAVVAVELAMTFGSVFRRDQRS
jgi:hypothetical protein